MNIFERATQLLREQRAFVMITMLSGKGHTPQDPGAKVLVTREGWIDGTIGGGKVEARAIAYAQELLQKHPLNLRPEVITWNLQKDIGMSCGGEGTYLFEIHSPLHWKIAVFGAGHVSQALCRTLVTLDAFITCVDSREDWIAKLPSHDRLKTILLRTPADEVENFDGNTFFIVMTQGHSSDVPVLKKIFEIHKEAPFIGVIGSEPKALKIKSELRELGIPEENLNRLRCPMGFPIGTNAPAEISISITAELLQVRDRWLSFSNAKMRDG